MRFMVRSLVLAVFLGAVAAFALLTDRNGLWVLAVMAAGVLVVVSAWKLRRS